jgi:uncharacterized protein YggE
MAAAKVKVRGEGVVSATPDEVAIALEVSVLEKSPEAALAEAGTRSQALDALFEELGIPKASRTTSGVSVAEERAWEKDREVFRGYRAVNRVVVRVPDPSSLGRLMTDAASRSQARIEGPWWKVAPDNPARAEACRQAAADARRKADAYASALGVRLGSVLLVTEPRVGVGPQGKVEFAQMAAARGVQAAADVPVQTGDLDVSAAIEVTFLIEQG